MNTKKTESTIENSKSPQNNDVNICVNPREVVVFFQKITTTFSRLSFSKKGLISIGLVILSGIGGASIEEILSLPSNEDFREHRIDFAEVCDYLKNNNPKLRTENITQINQRLVNNKRKWPVFNWRCELHEDTNITRSIGINLNEEYCQPRYGEKFKAYYKDYKEPDSWYCTHV